MLGLDTRPLSRISNLNKMAAWEGKSIFITGCNRGIGLAIVKHIVQLSTAPRYIFATCRSLKAESARELIELAANHSNLHLFELDVTNTSQLIAIVKEVGKRLLDAGLNLLINNAAIYDLKGSAYATKTSTLDEVTPEIMIKVYETNTIAPLMIAKYFLPILRKAAFNKTSCQPRAAIVNISSADGSIYLNHSGGLYQYKCSKAALNMITKSLSIDLAGDGITAICVDPGWIKTDMGGSAAPLTLSQTIPSLIKLLGSLDQSATGSFFLYDGTLLPW